MKFDSLDTAAAALKEGANFARVPLVNTAEDLFRLNWALKEVLPTAPYANHDGFKLDTLEAKAIMVGYEFLSKVDILSMHRKCLLNFIRKTTLELNRCFEFSGLYIRCADVDPDPTAKDQVIHTDSMKNKRSRHFVIVTLGDSKGTRVVCPSRETSARLLDLNTKKSLAYEEARVSGWSGAISDYPPAVKLGHDMNNVVPETEIIETQPYEALFLRFADEDGFSGDPTYHAAPVNCPPRGLLFFDDCKVR